MIYWVPFYGGKLFITVAAAFICFSNTMPGAATIKTPITCQVGHTVVQSLALAPDDVFAPGGPDGWVESDTGTVMCQSAPLPKPIYIVISK